MNTNKKFVCKNSHYNALKENNISMGGGLRKPNHRVFRRILDSAESNFYCVDLYNANHNGRVDSVKNQSCNDNITRHCERS
ncbi:hypothetical protein [Helicobacter fennelliae]|uniref:Uncharacterized protein n=2 Tax=Helicobacter TaxID=209 RepID=T1DVE0_9HELI|nr:hypothetical protein [Helicobacter fennelliae]GAD18457.1 hypothetical protein HFN_2385 [Helicobacter fennelliae MRY12-0050]STP08174.1 Uncharacterised protein [Helicobacter fennelliae]